MEMINSKIITSLLGETITSLTRVDIAEPELPDGMSNTLVFHLKGGKSFELLSRQEGQEFTEINEASPIHADFALYTDEVLIEVPVHDAGISLPFHVTGICEYIGLFREPYLIGLTFWSQDYNSQLCLLMETDQIEIISLEVLSALIMGRPYEYGRIEQSWHPISDLT